MKVHLIKVQSIERFVLENAQSKRAFEVWLSIIKRADWNTPQDIVITFNSADILGQGSTRVVFNIGGKIQNYLPIFFRKTKSTPVCKMDWNTYFIH